MASASLDCQELQLLTEVARTPHPPQVQSWLVVNSRCLITLSFSRPEPTKLKNIDKVHGETTSTCAYLLHNPTLYQNEASFPLICLPSHLPTFHTSPGFHTEKHGCTGQVKVRSKYEGLVLLVRPQQAPDALACRSA